MTLEHTRATMTYMMWHEEHLCNDVYSKEGTFPNFLGALHALA